MRLRNIPRANETIEIHPAVIKKPEERIGHWKQVFGNTNPIYIEIGMGKGQFLLCMAQKYPNINFIGIERYPSVMLRAVERLDTEEFHGMENIRFICMDARDINVVFAPDEVDRIFLNFSDPWPKARHARRRLTSKEFLERYEKIMIQGGQIEFKTDNTILFNFSLDQIKEAGWKLQYYTYDLHHHTAMMQDNVMTEYEVKFSGQGNPINKLIAVRK